MKRFLSIVLCFTMLFTLGSGALATDGDAQKGELVCGLEEHTHGPECYEQTQGDTLICGLEESEPVMESVPEIDPETGEETIVETVVSEGHTHSASCYETVETLVCGLEEHTHGPACYAVEEEQPENKPTVYSSNGLGQGFTYPETMTQNLYNEYKESFTENVQFHNYKEGIVNGECQDIAKELPEELKDPSKHYVIVQPEPTDTDAVAYVRCDCYEEWLKEQDVKPETTNEIKEFHYMDRSKFHKLFKELTGAKGSVNETVTGFYVYSDDGHSSRETRIDRWKGTKFYSQDCLIDGTTKYIQRDEVTKIVMECTMWGSFKAKSVELPLDRLEFREYPDRHCVEVWVKDPGQETEEYTVTFRYNVQGQSDKDIPTSVESGTVLTAEGAPKFERDGYTFTGWYADEDCTTEFDFATAIERDTDIYAGWEKNGSGQQEGEKLNITFKICNNSEHGHGEGHFSHTGESTIHSNSSVKKVWLKDGVLYADEACTEKYEYEQTVQNGQGDKKKYQLCGCDFTLSKSENQVYIYYKEDTGEVNPPAQNIDVAVWQFYGKNADAEFDTSFQLEGSSLTEADAKSYIKEKDNFVFTSLDVWGYHKNADGQYYGEATLLKAKDGVYDCAGYDDIRIHIAYDKVPEVTSTGTVNWYINLNGQIKNVGTLVQRPVAEFTGKLAADQTITINQAAWHKEFGSYYTMNGGVDNVGGLVGSDANDATAINGQITTFMKKYVPDYPGDAAIFEQLRSQGKQIKSVNGKLVDASLLNTDHYTIQWYVVKWGGDLWHIDGVLKEKPATEKYTVRYEWENSPVTNLPNDGKTVSYGKGADVEIDKTYKMGDTVSRREGTYTFGGWTIDGKAAEDFKIEANTVIRGVWTFKAAEVERAARYMIKHVYEGNDNLTSFESGDFDPKEKPAFETELQGGRFDKLMQGAYQVVERTYEGSYENAHGDIIFKYQISYKLADEKDPNYCYMLQHTYQGSSNLDHTEQGMLESKQAYEVALHSGLFDSTLQGAYQVVERRYEGSNKNANGDIVFHYTIVYKLADEKEPNTVYSLRHVYEGNDNLTSYDTGVLGNNEGELSRPMFEQDLHAARYDKTLQGAYQVVERTYEGSYKNGNGDIVFTYQISYKLAEGKESNAYYVIKHIYEGSSNLNIDENGAMEDEAAFQQTVDSGRYDRTLQGAYRVVSRVANDPYINANNDKIYIYEITYRLADEKEPNTYYSLKHVYEGNDNLNSYDNGYLSNEEGQLSKPMFEQDLYSGRYDKLQQGAYQVVERTYEGSQKNGNGDIIFTYLITYRMAGSHESSNTYYSLKHLYQGNDTLTSYENGELSEEEGQLSKTAFEQNLENGQFDKTQQGAYRIVSRVAEGSTVNANGDTVYMYVITYERINGGGDDDDDDDDIIEEEVDDNETPLTGLPGGDGQQTGDNGQNGQTSGTEEEVLDEEVPLANLPEQPEDGKNLPKTGGVVGAGLALVGLASVGGGMLLRRKDEENETGEDK